ncbi:MAG: helix-turn-helix domain-containing protein [Bacteroidota bacterium]
MDHFFETKLCRQCQKILLKTLKLHGIKPVDVKIGVMITGENRSAEEIELLIRILNELGFPCVSEASKLLSERTKVIVYKMVYENTKPATLSDGEFIGNELNLTYKYISEQFSKNCLISLKRYIINKRIERACELLLDINNLVGQVADKLSYKDERNFSNQFHQIKGITPKDYQKKILDNKEFSI